MDWSRLCTDERLYHGRGEIDDNGLTGESADVGDVGDNGREDGDGGDIDSVSLCFSRPCSSLSVSLKRSISSRSARAVTFSIAVRMLVGLPEIIA